MIRKPPSRAALSASSAFQQPPAEVRIRPGARVRMMGNPAVFEVLATDGTMVTLKSETGVDCRAGWRVLVPVEGVDHGQR